MVPQLGFTTTVVYYERRERLAGESKYPLRKMLSLAWEGITSFSVAPLRFITVLGLLTCMGAVALGLWALALGLFTTRAIPGWTSTVGPLAFIGGVQLLSLGVIGEYLSRIFLEVKGRPTFLIASVVQGTKAFTSGELPAARHVGSIDAQLATRNSQPNSDVAR